MKSFSLFELNEHLKRVVALNFQDAMWVRCEIAQIGESRGHYFFNLIEKGDTILAKANAILWARGFRRLQREHGRGIKKVLQEGLEVMLKLRVEYHEMYGIQYYIEDVNPDFTLGRLAMQKQQAIAALEKDGLIGRNAQIDLPLVLQRIAIISSNNAAGYQDYLKQINENSFGYSIENQLFSAAMQGENVEEEMLFQLSKIAKRKDNFDAVVVIRGGGARLDLMAFDNEKISRAVADFPIPVLTGIGHDMDESILDKVAHTALKTPTAVADFIINHNLFFENGLLQLGGELNYLAQEKLQEQYFLLQNLEQSVHWQAESNIKDAAYQLEVFDHDLRSASQVFIKKEKQQINHLEEVYELLKPEVTLKRGFSITSVNGKIIKSTKDLNSNKAIEITTQLSDGTIKSTTKHE